MRLAAKICLISSALLVAGSAVAQDFTKLKLVAIPEKAQILPGEPLVLRLQLHNPTGEAVKAHRDLDPKHGLLQVSIARGEEPFRRYFGPGWGTVEAIPKEEDIAAGELILGEAAIYCVTLPTGPDGKTVAQAVLTTPGRYRVQASWHQIDFKSSIKAAPVDVEVIAPQGSDLRIWQGMRPEVSFGLFMADALAEGGTVPTQAERLALSAPKSVYAQHLSLQLGRLFRRNRQWDAAEIHLNRALAAPAQSLLRRTALLELSAAYVQSNQSPKARELMAGARADFNGTPQEDLYKRIVAELDRIGG